MTKPAPPPILRPVSTPEAAIDPAPEPAASSAPAPASEAPDAAPAPAPAPPRGKPWITANQVTFLRLILLPVGAGCLYGPAGARYFALIFMTLVGCTDFVDGYLARKYGTTKLGSLMDPIADKVFVALVFIPFADKHWMPTWVIAGVFVREFLVTAARTSHERRGIVLKSSYLGKVKTWFQMAGAGIAFLLIGVHDRGRMNLLFGIGVGISAAGTVLALVLQRWNQVRGGTIFTISFAIFLGVNAAGGPDFMLAFMGYTILGITWLSGFDYLASGVRRLGPKLDGADYVRFVAAVAIPILALLCVEYTDAPVWAMIVVVAFELSLGGLDQLLAHYKAQPSGLAWGVRSFAIIALLAAILVEQPGAASMRFIIAVLMTTLSVVTTFAIFWQSRAHYVDERPAKVAA